MIDDGVIIPMELAHLPYKSKTFEDYVGLHGFKKYGKEKWQKEVIHIIEILQTALQAEKVVIGGGNAQHLTVIPIGCTIAANSNAFIGGFRLWEHFPGKLRAVPNKTPYKNKTNASKSISKKTPIKKNILQRK
jgi:polyphosphate glucokinase